MKRIRIFMVLMAGMSVSPDIAALPLNSALHPAEAVAMPAESESLIASEPNAPDLRAVDLLERLAAGLRSMGAYEVSFGIASGDHSTHGRYSVHGEKYYISLGDAEVYCDGKNRYEVDNRRREVTIDAVDPSSRNILDNPAHAFDFVGSQYAATIVQEQDGRAVVKLIPTSKSVSPAGEILLTVNTVSMHPLLIVYDYDGEKIYITISSVSPRQTPLPVFRVGDYKDYETIDFR